MLLLLSIKVFYIGALGKMINYIRKKMCLHQESILGKTPNQRGFSIRSLKKKVFGLNGMWFDNDDVK